MRYYDTIVVGSGFGGSVLAARLAQAGEQVLVLERGPWWGQGDGDGERQPFPRGVRLGRFVRNVRMNKGRRSREIVFNRRGLFEVHGFDHLWALGASGVGGGSLVYANGQGVPSPDYWDAFPPELTAEEMAPYYKLADEVLEPHVLPGWQARQEDLNRALRHSGLGETGAVELAVTFGPDPSTPETVHNAAGIRQQTCRMCGDCVLGCPHRSKNTLDLSYLAMAQRSGAVIHPMSEVVSVSSEPNGYWVHWMDHRSRHVASATSRRLVLAAGTLNTLRLLFAARSAGRLRPLPDALGRHLSPNGDYASLFWRVRSGSAGPGVVFNAIRRSEDHARDGLFLGEASAPVDSLPMPGVLRNWLRQSRFIFALGRDSATATATFDGHAVRCDAGRASDARYFARVEAVTRQLAVHYEPRSVVTNIPFGAGSPTIATTHTVGGAAMARRLEDAVVDHTGEVRGQPGLYVVDSSILAAPPGVPPSKTILAMAERIASIATATGAPRA
ncbi:MAG: NAD(P)-binding protein [Acidimicrobiia bacterium]|nr:NAD(P)-binding protein [Acidimicrobiia bacterium]